jgi:hypothetical protein
VDISKLTLKELISLRYQIDFEVLKRLWWIIPLMILIMFGIVLFINKK